MQINSSAQECIMQQILYRTHLGSKQRTTAAKSQVGHCSSNEEYLNSQDCSSLTAFSYESSLLEREEHISKIKSQRQKIEKLYVKFEQQKNCIEELQSYIDQLQKNNCQKDQQIQTLTQKIQQQTNKNSHTQNGSWKETVTHDKVVEIMREQTIRQQQERQRWSIEKEFMQDKWQNERDLLKEQIEELAKINQTKLRQFEQRWTQKEVLLNNKLLKAEAKNAQLSEQLARCLKGKQEMDELEKMMAFRKQLSKNEKQNRIEQMDSGLHYDLSLTKQQLDKLRHENNNLKRDQFKIKNQLQSKQFQLQVTLREKSKMESQLISQKQKYRQELAKLQRQLSSQSISKESLKYEYRLLNQKHQKLTQQYRILEEQLTQIDHKAHRLNSLRRVEFEEIDRMGSIFSNIDLNYN